MEDYRTEIKGKISKILAELEDEKNNYVKSVDEYTTEIAEITKSSVKNDSLGRMPAIVSSWTDMFRNYSSIKAEAVEKLYNEIADLVVTADTKEKKQILYEELDSTWKLRKK